MASNWRKLLQTCAVFRKFHTCLRLESQESTATSKISSAKKSKKVVIPRRVKRDELSVLRALASTVQQDANAPSYSFIDDPYLMPLNKLERRSFAFSKASGQKAAQYVLHRFPQNFVYDPAEPQIEAFMPPTGPQLAEDTLEGLTERITMRKPLEAYQSYQKITEAGVSVPLETVEDLLDILCYYNSTDPPELQYIEELHFQLSSGEKKKAIKNVWNGTGAAATLFSSLKNPSVRACCSMIRGCTKFQAYESAWTLYKQLRDKNEQPDVRTFNALIGIIGTWHSSAEEKWHHVLDLLKDMAAAGVSPDINTFNSILLILTYHRKYTVVRTWSMQMLNELNECGLEPSLTTWSHLLTIHYANPDSRSPLLVHILDELNGRQLTLHCHTDYEFFSNAMRKCHDNLQDLDLAYKIDALLNVGNNRSLLGYSSHVATYYSMFLRLLCTFAQIDTVMAYYDKLVPHVFTPPYVVASDLLMALELSEGFQYLPRLWNDMKLLAYEKLTLLTEQLLVIMAKKRHQQQLQDLFVKVVDDIRLEAEDNGQQRPRLHNLSGKALGYMAQIYLHNDSFDDAWDLMETYIEKRNMVDGFPSESSLVHIADVCIELRDVTRTLKVLSLMADFAYPKFEELVSKVQSTLELTEEQKSQLDDM